MLPESRLEDVYEDDNIVFVKKYIPLSDAQMLNYDVLLKDELGDIEKIITVKTALIKNDD